MRAIEQIRTAVCNMDDYALMAGIDPVGPRKVLGEAIDELAQLRAENESLRKDAERIDWLEKNMTGASNSERYLPFRVYWGDGRGIRKAIDAAMKGGTA